VEGYFFEHVAGEFEVRRAGVAVAFTFVFSVGCRVFIEDYMFDVYAVDGGAFDDYIAGKAGGVAEKLAGVDVVGDGLLKLRVEGAQLVAEASGEVCEIEVEHGGVGVLGKVFAASVSVPAELRRDREDAERRREKREERRGAVMDNMDEMDSMD